MRRSIISLGDALRVCTDLRPEDDAARLALRELLGLQALRDGPVQTKLGAWMATSGLDVMVAQRKAAAAQQRRDWPPADTAGARPAVAGPTPVAAAGAVPRATGKLVRLQRSAEPVVPPPWLAQVPALPTADEPDELLPPPLFDRLRQRSILSSALATQVDEGDLDLQRIVATVSVGQPLARLLRMPLPTLRRGVQLLLDVGPAMDPYAADQRGLVKALDDLLADDRLALWFFSRCPGRRVWSEPGSTPCAWRPPAHGAPVIVLSDLGIGGPLLDRERPGASEWLGFARRVREAGHALVGLVPYEATRWPRRLQLAMVLIHWSERTTVGTVRRALRDASGRFGR